MALTTSTFSIFHFKYEQIRAIPLPESLGIFLKVGKAERGKEGPRISQFLLGEGCHFFWFDFQILLSFWPLKHKTNFSFHTVLILFKNLEIYWRSENKHFICFSFWINTFSSGLWKKTGLPLSRPKMP